MKYKIASIFSYNEYQITVHYDCIIDVKEKDLSNVHNKLLENISIVFDMMTDKLIIKILKNDYFEAVTIGEGDYRIIDDNSISLLSKEMFVLSLVNNKHIFLLIDDSCPNGILQFTAVKDYFYYQKYNESEGYLS